DTLEASLDSDANAVVALTTPTPLSCCSDPNFAENFFGPGFTACYYTSDPNCIAAGGIPGATGTVCDGATGACTTPPAKHGGTCSADFTAVVGGTRCIAGPAFHDLTTDIFGYPRAGEALSCGVVGLLAADPNSKTPGKYDPNGVCPPDG